MTPVSYGGGGSVAGGGGGPDLTDDWSVGVKAAESNAALTDVPTYAMTLALADTNTALTETATLSVATYADSSIVPTDTRSGLIKLWGSGSAGTGVANPTNANGPNDGVSATIATAPVGAATETLTSNCGNAVAAGTPFPTSIKFRGWYRLQTVLATSTARVLVNSSDGTFTDIVIETLSAANGDNNHLTTPLLSAELVGTIDTLAKLQTARIQYQTTDVVAGTSPATVTADAGSLELTGVL